MGAKRGYTKRYTVIVTGNLVASYAKPEEALKKAKSIKRGYVECFDTGGRGHESLTLLWEKANGEPK